jgi:hypothetical protein
MWGIKINLFKHWPLGLNNEVHTTLVKAIGLKELHTSQVPISTLSKSCPFQFYS